MKYMRITAGYTWTDYRTNTHIVKELKITSILDKLLEYKRNWIQHVNRMPRNTGLFISPSEISELDCPTTKTDRAERGISIGRESLQVFFFNRSIGVLPGFTARG